MSLPFIGDTMGSAGYSLFLYTIGAGIVTRIEPFGLILSNYPVSLVGVDTPHSSFWVWVLTGVGVEGHCFWECYVWGFWAWIKGCVRGYNGDIWVGLSLLHMNILGFRYVVRHRNGLNDLNDFDTCYYQ